MGKFPTQAIMSHRRLTLFLQTPPIRNRPVKKKGKSFKLEGLNPNWSSKVSAVTVKTEPVAADEEDSKELLGGFIDGDDTKERDALTKFKAKPFGFGVGDTTESIFLNLPRTFLKINQCSRSPRLSLKTLFRLHWHVVKPAFQTKEKT